MARGRKAAEEKQLWSFLQAYAGCGNLARAAREAGISRDSHRRWLLEVDGYREAFRDAEEAAVDQLEEEARRRALTGVDRTLGFYS